MEQDLIIALHEADNEIARLKLEVERWKEQSDEFENKMWNAMDVAESTGEEMMQKLDLQLEYIHELETSLALVQRENERFRDVLEEIITQSPCTDNFCSCPSVDCVRDLAINVLSDLTTQ